MLWFFFSSEFAGKGGFRYICNIIYIYLFIDYFNICLLHNQLVNPSASYILPPTTNSFI